MPYRSDSQRRWAHTDAGLKALGGKDKVAEWDAASRGMNLPEKAKSQHHAVVDHIKKLSKKKT